MVVFIEISAHFDRWAAIDRLPYILKTHDSIDPLHLLINQLLLLQLKLLAIGLVGFHYIEDGSAALEGPPEGSVYLKGEGILAIVEVS